MAFRKSSGHLNCGRKPDPGALRQVEQCHGKVTVRQYRRGEAPDGVGAVELVTTTLHRLGVRRWFSCPGCRGRCGILYQPTQGDPWRCRACHELTYRSSQEAYREERIWWGMLRLYRHFEEHGDQGGADSFEAMLDGLSTMSVIAVCRAAVYCDIDRNEADRAAFIAADEAERTDFAIDLSL